MINTKLQPSDLKQLKKVHEVCTWPNPYERMPKAEETFALAMKEVLTWHQSKSKFFFQFLQDKKFSIDKWNGEMEELPFIPADFFKQHEVKSISDSEIYLHLTSSGTTGQKSQIFFDEWSLKSAQQMVDFIYQYYRWISKDKTNYLLYTYQTEEGSKLGTAYTDNYLTEYAPINSIEYALKWNGKGGHDFDLFGAIKTLENFEK
ncbi:MAG: hypothetical protein KDD45_08380, partial [Bdellovibrionales bacterium]|nr:hypothetical protein [Bdellovibrionales bacterium]